MWMAVFVGFYARIMRDQREDIHPVQNTRPYFRLRAPDRNPNRKFGNGGTAKHTKTLTHPVPWRILGGIQLPRR